MPEVGSAEPAGDAGKPGPGPYGWCVCGEKVTIAGAVEITLPNGRDGWEGSCPECGAPLFAIRRKPKLA
jgi:hypothetical protein